MDNSFDVMEEANDAFLDFMDCRQEWYDLMSTEMTRYEYFFGEMNFQCFIQKYFGVFSGRTYFFITGWFMCMLKYLLPIDQRSFMSFIPLLFWLPLIVLLIYHVLFNTLNSQIEEE